MNSLESKYQLCIGIAIQLLSTNSMISSSDLHFKFYPGKQKSKYSYRHLITLKEIQEVFLLDGFPFRVSIYLSKHLCQSVSVIACIEEKRSGVHDVIKSGDISVLISQSSTQAFINKELTCTYCSTIPSNPLSFFILKAISNSSVVKLASKLSISKFLFKPIPYTVLSQFLNLITSYIAMRARMIIIAIVIKPPENV